jgi:predicted transposase/invertase (TIGR01784 family)
LSGNPELVDEIKSIEEVKTMLSTSLKKYGEELKREGFEQGIAKGKIDTAKVMLARNMPLKEIAEITGLSVDTIEKLKDKK